MSKLYIAVLDEVPDFMVPTLVAHSVLGAHINFTAEAPHMDQNIDVKYLEYYDDWLECSFKKCTLRVNQKEFDKISELPAVYLGHENTTLEGRKSCAVVCPRDEYPNVLNFAKLWKPKEES